MPPKNALVVFAKIPQAGRVKTRLLGELSPQQAADLHRACLEDTIRLVDSIHGCRRILLFAPLQNFSVPLPRFELGSDWHVRWQRGPDLGVRLERAFEHLFRTGARKVIAVGTDSPWIGPERIQRALAWLDHNDVVLGPTEDGGYYLLGARRLIRQMFRAVPWGTAQVLPLTVRALDRAQARYCFLPLDFDLDRPQDFRRAAELLRRDRSRAQTLARCLTDYERQ